MLESLRQLAIAPLVMAAIVVAASDAAAEAPVHPKPSIVLVHGAFADGSSWDHVASKLQTKGFTTLAVHQPLTSFADDVAATQRAIEAQPGEVVLVGHSYGGAVITEAGNSPKVVSLVYVAAFGPDAGESINDLGKGKPAPIWASALQVTGGFGSLPMQIVVEHFAQDLPAADAKLLAAKQGPIKMTSFDAKISNAAWRSRPVYYVLATQDHMIAPEAQTTMAERMHANVTSVAASHVVMLSKPNEVVKAIVAATTPAPRVTAAR
jgi:pimeloyl-ACP methyl ester carboxylesterase